MQITQIKVTNQFKPRSMFIVKVKVLQAIQNVLYLIFIFCVVLKVKDSFKKLKYKNFSINTD